MVIEQLGSYAILETISQTKLSRLVLAEHLTTHLRCAIKVLLHDYRSTPEVVSYFEREAICLAHLQHPNIARVLDCGLTSDGLPFLVMEYIDGMPLDRFIRQRPRPTLSCIFDLTVRTCAGLQAAAQQHIVHLDIKPGNLMVTRTNAQLKIVDFGLARQLWKPVFTQQGQQSNGDICGTPRYMSPEQCCNTSMDHRSDIYSFGATFYHLLGGQPPFADLSDSELLKKRNALRHPMPLQEIYPDIPQDMCEIIMRMLEFDPTMRYQDYDALLADLDTSKLLQLAREAR
ncbi:TPA: hypothetical protein DDW35_00610 [Candidatus Sumerlaeota bacterium]|jgi:eukaryotic-like serine/threonine-protein kinase|nr:hypothetical protein [Candidatus Sumerlaeota bacterium]